jgi:hypothetical protein
MRQEALIGSGVAAVAIGIIMSAEATLFVGTHPKAATVASPTQFVMTAAPETMKIVPSPVIETNPSFFYGTGDGNGGYAEQPK